MKIYKKADFPVSDIRRYLEPGPIVLVSSHWRDKTNIMTMGWHTVMEFSPSLVGCIVSRGSHSFEMIRNSRQCVINVPTADIAATVVKIGNCSGASVDKFKELRLSAADGEEVDAPLIEQCPVSLECQLADGELVDKYNFFIFEVVKAHAALSPKNPKTLHYRGHGEFMVAGGSRNLRKFFRPEML